MLEVALPALERDGLALALIACADRRVIASNAVLSQLSGHPAALLRERGLGLLVTSETEPATLAALDRAIAAGSELRGEICWARADGSRFWFGFTVIPLGAVADAGPSVLLMGRDITERRRRAREEATVQAVLALVFRSIDVAAAVILPDDRILAANPAYAALTGYGQRDLEGMSVDRLTAPESRDEARRLRAALRRTGEAYRMPLALRRKDGSVLPVELHAVAVEYEGTRFRVVTLHRKDDRAAEPEARRQLVVGKVGLIRLDPLKEAYGARWPQVEARLMMLAEQVLKRRLESGDVYARTPDGGFAVWFARGNETEKADRIAAITRAIRIRLIGALDEGVAPEIRGHAAWVPAQDIEVPPGPETLASTLMERLAARQTALRAEVLAGLKVALAAPAMVQERLVTPDGATGLIWTALAPELVRRIEAARALAEERDAAGLPDPDLVLLGAAAEQVLTALARGERLPWAVPVSFETVAVAGRRRALLAACRALPAGAREGLTPVLDGMPPGVNPQRLVEFGQDLAPLFGALGIATATPALPPLPPGLGPFSLLVFDGTALQPVPEARLSRLFGEARMRRLRVAVRQAGPQAQRLARLGAQFVGVAA
ncbi:PAS domain S-box protein [Elioraea sp. Yellowstone]|uniref:PAS domain-containing protein n=1 Tax=Elioraea sp. Yellowstone TaxID=2592070 RepID=UPI0011504B75|nr:PAS domain S-box protein [Elioraea sp. Yellowstone]TQF83781.1 PAS domain S-box protein [Elioraea sp. Yellowstone]